MAPRVVPTEVVRVIDRYFPQPWVQANEGNCAQIGNQHTGAIAAIIGLIDRVPENLITLTAEAYADFIAAVETIRVWPPVWQARGAGHTFGGEPIRTIRRALANCPDEFPSPAVHELTFLHDPELRDELRLDIDRAERALANGEWKAATVLAGSVVEALLLWKLSTLNAADVTATGAALRAAGTVSVRVGSPLNEWTLPDYIEVAAVVPANRPLVVTDTAALLRVVKNYRNLIHPGRAKVLSS